jgi:hypothetical protein
MLDFDDESDAEYEARIAAEDAAAQAEWERDRHIWSDPEYLRAMYEANPDSLVRAIEGFEAAAISSEKRYPRAQYPFLYEHESAGSDPFPGWEPWQIYLRAYPDVAEQVLQSHPIAAASLYQTSSQAEME